MDESVTAFIGFQRPEQNWSKLPHEFIDALPLFETIAEIKVVLYVLRHTWGYQEFDQQKRITLDEFIHGRKRRDGSRIDKGTGLSRNSVRDGVRRAAAHGFLRQEIEDRCDGARRSHVYCLRMNADAPETARGAKFDPLHSNFSPSEGQVLPPEGSKSAPRSEKETEEETGDRNQINKDVADGLPDFLVRLLSEIDYDVSSEAALLEVKTAYQAEPGRVMREAQAVASNPGRFSNPAGMFRAILRGKGSAVDPPRRRQHVRRTKVLTNSEFAEWAKTLPA